MHEHHSKQIISNRSSSSLLAFFSFKGCSGGGEYWRKSVYCVGGGSRSSVASIEESVFLNRRMNAGGALVFDKATV